MTSGEGARRQEWLLSKLSVSPQSADVPGQAQSQNNLYCIVTIWTRLDVMPVTTGKMLAATMVKDKRRLARTPNCSRR